jgi:hypothetical protein
MSEMPTGPQHHPGRYEIRLKGHLDFRSALAAGADGMAVIRRPAGVSVRAVMPCATPRLVKDGRLALRGTGRRWRR